MAWLRRIFYFVGYMQTHAILAVDFFMFERLSSNTRY